MSIVKAEVSDAYLVQHGVPKIGSTFVTDEGKIGVVVMSNPDTSEKKNILIDVPDTAQALSLIDLSRDTADSGRRMHEDYTVQWRNPKVYVAAMSSILWEISDTFEKSGMTDEVLSACNWEDVAAACLDTGIRDDHEAFAGYVVYRWAPDGYDGIDYHGHGTFCLSELGGKYGCMRCRLLAMFQALPNRSGSGTELSVAQAAHACRSWVRTNGKRITIVSASLGGSTSSVIRGAFEGLASEPNAVVVVAAGNGGPTQPNGSPGDARGVYVVGAADREYTPADFTGGGKDATWVNGGQFGVQIIGANKDGGFTQSDGTSMAAPLAGGVAGSHAAKGRSKSEILQLMGANRQHQLNPPGRWGVVQLDRADFISEPLPPPEEEKEEESPIYGGDIGTAIEYLTEAQFQLGNPPDGLRYEEPPSTATKAEIRAWAKKVQAASGIAWQYIDYSIGLLKKVDEAPDPEPPPPPPPPPTIPKLACVYGTYGIEHGSAVDAYPGRNDDEVHWGPHHGHPIIAPADGRVEVYAFGTPLSLDPRALYEMLGVTDYSAYALNWHALFDKWACWAATPLQTMYVAVFWPNNPLNIEGRQVVHLHYGHVHPSIRIGAVQKGELFAISWDSGVRFEPGNPVARCAHVHCCAGAGTSLSPNGDLPGRLAIVAQGWQATDIGFVPGPKEYAIPNKYCAGRLYSDFVSARRQPPPVPA